MTRFDVIYRKTLLSKIFCKGWGNPDLLIKLLENRKNFINSPSCYNLVDPNLNISIDKRKESKEVINLEGSFLSPFEDVVPGSMRGSCHIAKFQMLQPKKWRDPDLRPVVIHFAGTGDHNYLRRRVFLANRLLKDGIASIILMNPFYGDRKPKDQTLSNLNYLSDLFVMGGSLMMECSALLHWCERQGFGPLAVHGISMGGYMAGLAASIWPKPISVIPCLSWTTASNVFRDGVLSQSVCWDVLNKQYLNDKVYRQEIRPMLQPAVPAKYRVLSAQDLSGPALALQTVPSAASNLAMQQQQNPQKASRQQRSYSTGGSQASDSKPSSRFNVFRYDALLSRLEPLASRLSGPSSALLAEVDVAEKRLMQRLRRFRAPKPSGPLDEEAGEFFCEILDVFTHMGNYNAPRDPSLVVSVVAEFDSYVPRAGVASLEQVWPGMESRQLGDMGHIGAYLRSSVWTQDIFRQAIRDSLNLQVKKTMGRPGPF